ncbi:MAG: hypothetical protein JW958_10205 [Candidatus Eisenbacteria bacterium]|nr:hypothetical protein [Candidatus Eisenbacteria bacterium]
MTRALRGLGVMLLAAVVFFGGHRAARSGIAYFTLPGEPPPGEAGAPTLREWDLLDSVREKDRLAAAASAIPSSLDPFHLPPEEDTVETVPVPEEETVVAEAPAGEPSAAREVVAPSVRPERSPPDRAEADGAESYAIPVVLRWTGAGTGSRVVLDFGSEQSPPLAEGEGFREWRVAGFSADRVYLAHRGVTYTLPLP